MNNILIDFERLKYPNTGLYTFCSMLGRALIKKKLANQNLTFYVPAKELNLFGTEENYYTQRVWHKVLTPKFSEFDVWHATNQVSDYLPSYKKSKMVLTIHDLNFLIEKRGRKNKISSEIKKIQNNIDRCDIVTTISQYVKNDIEKNFDLKGKKIQIIYNGGILQDEGIQQLKVHSDKPFFFTIGTVLPKKNFHVLVPLLLDNDFDLIIAGNISSSEYAEKILAFAEKCGVKNRVKIIGPISDSEKNWYYKNCYAFLFTSIAEGFGLPVIEAMSFGKPVFLSDHTSLPEIGGEVAYYFNSFDADYMKGILEKGMSDYHEHEDARLIEIKNQASKFTWEKAADEYLNIYNDIVSI